MINSARVVSSKRNDLSNLHWTPQHMHKVVNCWSQTNESYTLLRIVIGLFFMCYSEL